MRSDIGVARAEQAEVAEVRIVAISRGASVLVRVPFPIRFRTLHKTWGKLGGNRLTPQDRAVTPVVSIHRIGYRPTESR